jgi:subtilisin family serine protease
MQKPKKAQKWFSLLLLFGMLFSLIQPTAALAQDPEPSASITVDPVVLQEINANGSASYWVEFRSEASLSSAKQMNWEERGWYVYNQLTEQATHAQHDVVDYLKRSGVKYQSYWINNTILVQSSNLTTLNGLMSFAEIEAIKPRKSYILYEPDRSTAVTDNQIMAVEPNLTHINADDAWAMGYTGDGLVVANIDTGVRYSHDALVNQYRGNEGGTFDHNYNWFDPDNLIGVPYDGNGHGTHTMGTIVGDDGGSNQIGVAPGADWIACAGCPNGSCTDTALLGCAQWIAAPTDTNGNNPDPSMRPNVVNNSWGDCGTSYDPWYQAVVDAWHSAGVYPVFSNGNSSNCGYASPPGLNTVGNPARYGNVTGVGSSGEQDGLYASHSNWGPTDNLDTVNAVPGFANMKPQVIAPGVSIRSSTPGSDTEYQDGWSGTSMSAPHVTGLMALIWQAAPCLIGDYATTETLIEDTAIPVVYDDGSSDTPTNDPNYAAGWGEIDALAAVQAAAGMCGDSTLDGTVTDATTSEPLAGTKVTITALGDPANNRTLYTNADGYYSTAVWADTYDIMAEKFGYGPETVTGVVLVSGGTSTTDFALDELDTAMVTGFVYDGGIEGGAVHGYPLYASLTFSSLGFNQTVYSDPFSGAYEIELYLGQEYNVTVAGLPGGYEPFVGLFTPDTAPDAQDYTLYVEDAACAAPGYQPEYDLYWNFESDADGFTPGGTTSFAWGDFTSGPGEGHSGTKGLATNPAGDYNVSEEGFIASPAIDLTGYGANSTVLQWWDWKEIESQTYDWARLDVTKDGGVTWTTVWGPVGGVSDTAYNKQTVVLDSSYNVANFQFRFYFKSDSSVQYAGWYVDDIGISEVSVPPATTVWSSNFDANNGGFTASGTSASWAWGAPTSGPGAAHSAPNVWATNLAGNYNDSEESYITSPVIDLSSYDGLAPSISFWHWNDIESISFDWGAVEVTNDGSVTWTDVTGKVGDVSPWTPLTIALDSTYTASNFQFRFHFLSDSSVTYTGWYIDDVAVTVGEEVSLAAPCVAQPGGVVAGYVYDGNTSAPLTGATVASDTGVVTETFANPDDPIEGFYWLFQSTATDPEDIAFTASMTDYADVTANVSVVSDAITQQDFYLGTGNLEFDPLVLEKTMTLGDAPATETLTISNTGTADATFELMERERGFTPLHIPAFTGDIPASSVPSSIGRAPGTTLRPLSSAGLFNDLLAGEPAFAVDAYPGENLVSIPDTTAPGVWNVVGSVASTAFFAGDFTGGDFSTLYVVNYNDNNLYAVDTSNAAYTLVGATTPPAGETFSGLSGEPGGELYGLTTTCAGSSLVTVDPATGATTLLGALPGIDCGIDLAYNTDEDQIYIVDIITDSLFRVDPGTLAVTNVGLLGVAANYAQGMDYEEETGILYWAAYTAQGELRVIDMSTGASALVGAFPSGAEVDSFAFATGGTSDVPWLSEDPVMGLVPAGGSTDITVTFDPSSLGQPGDYQAELRVGNDTPYTYPNIPVTLHIQRPADWGTFNGTVNGMERCDVNPAALDGATVNFYDSADVMVASTTSDADGYYSSSLEEGIYDIEITADGFVSQMVYDYPVDGGETVTVNFDLRLDAPCLVVDPTTLEQSLYSDTTASQTLTLSNWGAADVDFELVELEAQISVMADVEMVVDDGTAEDAIGLTSGGGFIWLNRFTPNPDAFPFYLDEVQVLFESTVAVDSQMQVVVYSDTDGDGDPGTGAVYLGGETFGVDYNDNATWNIFTLTEPIQLDGPGDVLIGIVNRTTGLSIYPAAIDTTASQGRSWVGAYAAGDPPAEPSLPADSLWGTIDSVGFPGNFTLRGMGSSAVTDILWLSEDPTLGTVPADSSLDVTVTFDATGLALDDYYATLRVLNSPDPSINIPTTLHVIDNLPPVANDQDVITAEDTPVGITLGASDVDGDDLTWTIVDGPDHGALSGTAPNLIYTPADDFYGTDSFTFKVNDGEFDSNVATVTITVNDQSDVKLIFLPQVFRH